MPDFFPLNSDTHARMGWAPFTDLHHVADRVLVPVVQAELPALLPGHALAFGQVSPGVFRLFALMGLHQGRNVFIGPDGKYWGSYVPAQLRGQPFAVQGSTVDGEERLALCFDRDSGRLREDPDTQAGELAFFDGAGGPSEILSRTMEFLRNLALNGRATQKAVDALAGAGVLRPWALKVENPDPATPLIEGLYRADLRAIHALEPVALAALEDAHALHIAHAQALSTGRTGLLAGLARLRLAGTAPAPLPGYEDDEGDMFDFHLG